MCCCDPRLCCCWAGGACFCCGHCWWCWSLAAFVVASSLRSSFFGRRSSGMPPADPAPEAPVAASLRRPPPPLPPLPPPAPISSSFSSSCFCFDDRYSVASCASSAEFLKVTTVRRCSPWPTLTVVRPGKYSWTVLWIRNRRREFTAGNRSAQLRRGPRGRRCVNNLSTGTRVLLLRFTPLSSSCSSVEETSGGG